ncbi:hypothetical protein [Neisseria sp. Ec49-e6-T10]|uniref:hypothetical protein n=1 Tax=Neisseria sp. Ec49-e6-T10 TaxID=3140744 RepID=UPI003EB7B5A5
MSPTVFYTVEPVFVLPLWGHRQGSLRAEQFTDLFLTPVCVATLTLRLGGAIFSRTGGGKMSDSDFQKGVHPDFIIHKNIVEKSCLNTPFCLTARFYDVSGEDAEHIYHTAMHTQQCLQKGNSALLHITEHYIQHAKQPNIDMLQDILSMQYYLSELMRGIQLSIFTVAGTAEQFEWQRLKQEET